MPHQNFELQLNQAVDALISSGGLRCENGTMQQLLGAFVALTAGLVRLVSTCRREVLNHVIVLGEHYLKRLIAESVRDYQDDRKYLGLEKSTPAGGWMRTNLAGSAKSFPCRSSAACTAVTISRPELFVQVLSNETAEHP